MDNQQVERQQINIEVEDVTVNDKGRIEINNPELAEAIKKIKNGQQKCRKI